jgi:large subunit ribosomal protein L31
LPRHYESGLIEASALDGVTNNVHNKIDITMKADIHPSNYREVVFKDMSNDEIFITRSTVASKETIEVDGVTYPLVKLEITSSSHPFFTGKQKLVDTAGRVDKFMSRYGNRVKK